MPKTSEDYATATIGCGFILFVAAVIFFIFAAGIWLLRHS